MKRPLFVMLLFAVAGCFAGSAPAPAAERLNVLVILVDDLKPSFGAYGESWVSSPNLDRLAARGVRFDRAYCNQAVCAPSRNNLLTGARSTSLGVYSLGYNFRKAVPNAVTLPQYFKQHGYHCAGVGKVFHIGHGNVGDDVSWSVPFQTDKVVDYVLPESTGGQLTREEALFSNKSAHGLPRGAAWERSDVDDGAYADGRIAAEGVKRLRAYQKSKQPFFLALGFTKPHLPFCAGQILEFVRPEQAPSAGIHDAARGRSALCGQDHWRVKPIQAGSGKAAPERGTDPHAHPRLLCRAELHGLAGRSRAG